MPPVRTVSMWEPVITGGPGRSAGPGGHHVADGVDGDVEAEVAHPGDDEVAAVAVGLGERQPAAPAVARVAHRAELPEPAQEALTVDPQRAGDRRRARPPEWG